MDLEASVYSMFAEERLKCLKTHDKMRFDEPNTGSEWIITLSPSDNANQKYPLSKPSFVLLVFESITSLSFHYHIYLILMQECWYQHEMSDCLFVV